MSNFIIFTISYALLVAGIVYPPQEFVSAGITITEIFASWLGSEPNAFIQYHIKRSILTLLIHSLLPLGYVAGLSLFGHIDVIHLLFGTEQPIWSTLCLCALVGPIYSLYRILIWSQTNWSKHPIAINLSVYCDEENKTWMDVAANINREFKSLDKLQIISNTVTKVVVTDNWIIKVSPYRLDVASQSNAKLICYKVSSYASTSSMAEESISTYVKYRVCTNRPGGKNFTVRLNYNDVENFTGKVTMPIFTLPTCEFPKRLKEIYIDWIKEEVNKNPFYITNLELEKCAICIQTTSNVKIVKRCPDFPTIDNTPACRTCNCPPRLCLDCLVKWFIASSVDLNRHIENLTQLKSSCPQCRATFCISDVSHALYDPLHESDKAVR
ncbi:E3 ubiquitin-protein ligase TM129 [Chelonus insularis]|uniref:E3 ubiquitin-protein ligase TM129 n=1 Tax=Chelonus insularis TaxID=460826 RepID=UPI00158F48AD|nr:E3 ubiquitin-protein ligase TM129 [Chelonus insularis]